MRNLLALIGFALVAFLVAGWYLDWYHITPKATATPGQQGEEIIINKKKIRDDVDRGIKVGGEKLHGLMDQNGQPVTTAPAAR